MYYKNYPHIFSPVKIGNVTLKNRIAMSPMGTAHTGPDHRFSEELIRLYETRAQGGVGMIISESGYVEDNIDHFPITNTVPRIDHINKVAKMAEYVTRVNAYGTVACSQFSIGVGRQADSPHLFQPVSASECPSIADPNIMCRALTVDEIHELVAACGRAAKYASAAGVQIMELHGHSGYLIDQFLSPDINKRTDEYGGSPENRFRIVKEIREVVREATGGTMPVTLRISVDHKWEGGRTLEEGLEYCKMAEAAGFDGLHVDAGRYESMNWIFPSNYLGPTCLLDLAAAVKQVVNIPVIAVGNFGTPEEIEEAIASGKCDLVAMGRGLLADPDFANKARVGKAQDIRPCLRCNEYCLGHTRKGVGVSCAVNPECGAESYLHVTKAEEKKRVTVIGGGPGGMEAAITAARRGHTVTLIEKSDHLGGLMDLSEAEEFKYTMKQLKKWFVTQVEELGVHVMYNTPATVEIVKATEPDVVIVATGSDVFIPNIPGFCGRDDVVTIRQLKQLTLKGDEKIVMAGGGLVACEAGLGLAMEGHDVTVIEMTSVLARDMVPLNQQQLISEMKDHGVTLCTETRCERVEGKTLICTDKEGNELRFDFDYLLAALGTKSVNDLNEAMLDAFPEVFCIGDCVATGRMHIAIHQGFYAALHI